MLIKRLFLDSDEWFQKLPPVKCLVVYTTVIIAPVKGVVFSGIYNSNDSTS